MCGGCALIFIRVGQQPRNLPLPTFSSQTSGHRFVTDTITPTAYLQIIQA